MGLTCTGEKARTKGVVLDQSSGGEVCTQTPTSREGPVNPALCGAL